MNPNSFDSSKCAILGLLGGLGFAALSGGGGAESAVISSVMAWIAGVGGNQFQSWFSSKIKDPPPGSEEVFKNHHISALLQRAIISAVEKHANVLFSQSHGKVSDLFRDAGEILAGRLGQLIEQPEGPFAELHDFNVTTILQDFVVHQGKVQILTPALWKALIEDCPQLDGLSSTEKADLIAGLHQRFGEALWGLFKHDAAHDRQAFAAVELLYLSRILQAVQSTPAPPALDLAPIVTRTGVLMQELKEEQRPYFVEILGKISAVLDTQSHHTQLLLQILAAAEPLASLHLLTTGQKNQDDQLKRIENQIQHSHSDFNEQHRTIRDMHELLVTVARPKPSKRLLQLMAQLQDPLYERRSQAAKRIEEFGSEALPALEVVLGRLEDLGKCNAGWVNTDDTESWDFANALRAIGVTPETFERFVVLLDHRYGWVQIAAAHALADCNSSLWPPSRLWLKLINDSVEKGRRIVAPGCVWHSLSSYAHCQIVDSLISIDRAKQAIEDPELRTFGYEALSNMIFRMGEVERSHHASELVPFLIRRLEMGELGPPECLVAMFGPMAQAAIPFFAPSATDITLTWRSRYSYICKLMSIQPAAHSWVLVFFDCLAQALDELEKKTSHHFAYKDITDILKTARLHVPLPIDLSVRLNIFVEAHNPNIYYESGGIDASVHAAWYLRDADREINTDYDKRI